jgi:hypothetical protein
MHAAWLQVMPEHMFYQSNGLPNMLTHCIYTWLQVMPEHVLRALTSLGFPDFVDEVTTTWNQFKEDSKGGRVVTRAAQPYVMMVLQPAITIPNPPCDKPQHQEATQLAVGREGPMASIKAAIAAVQGGLWRAHNS